MLLMDQLLDLAATPREAFSAPASTLARFSFLDWMACGLAGRQEPVAKKLRTLAQVEAGRPVASIFGGVGAPARMAALVNGATSHALDYDDTHFAHVGHLSVAIYPAALAVAEELNASAGDTMAAFLAGAEGSIRLGKLLGRKTSRNDARSSGAIGHGGLPVVDRIRSRSGQNATSRFFINW